MLRNLLRKTATPEEQLPIPPLEMRRLVGLTDLAHYDNPTGGLVFVDLPPESFRRVLDFGCGCGRIARLLMQQIPRPERYEGIDLHAGMIQWCSENLAPRAPGFNFRHHDVLYAGFNPGEGKPLHDRLPYPDDEFSLVVAISVFTHLTQEQTEAYLAELSRVLGPGGVALTTWFLFDKHEFPMMQEQQNTLFINEHDVRNAVIYSHDWVRAAAAEAGLTLSSVYPPTIRGFHWELRLTPTRDGVAQVDWPPDEAALGRRPPPSLPAEAHRIGRR
jgi:SAM-dependent methyltransferase